MSMCTSWMFCSPLSCWLSKRREVSSISSVMGNFLKFTRQINIDYAVCQSLGYNTGRLKQALIAYDVACQWSIHFDDRVNQSIYLDIPKGLKYTAAVGKFHLAAHCEECFAHYSLNFVEGAGQQDGEVIETLWAALNKAAGSTRAMTQPHRQEMLDAQILDSNWKKHINMGMLLHPDLVPQVHFSTRCSGQPHSQICQSSSSKAKKFGCIQRARWISGPRTTQSMGGTRAHGYGIPWWLPRCL